MNMLERLYRNAEDIFSREPVDWARFTWKFEQVSKSRLILYRTKPDTEVVGAEMPIQILACSSPEMLRQYIADGVYEYRDLMSQSIGPFEPARRSDTHTDAAFKAHPIYDGFLKPHAIFHIMGVVAHLHDGSFLVMFVWRSESEADFSDMEKLRLALFMRMLAKHFGTSTLKRLSRPKDEIRGFGNAYGLTKAETLVLADLLDGYSLKDIARKSGRTFGTVRWHVHNLFVKCDVQSQKNLLSEFYKLFRD